MIMDRLPLVQALTASGLQRDGAEQVATALGDAIESSVASRSDVAGLNAAFARLEASMKTDFQRLESAIDQLAVLIRSEFDRLDASWRAEMHAMENRLLLRTMGLFFAAVGVLFALLRTFGHAP